MRSKVNKWYVFCLFFILLIIIKLFLGGINLHNFFEELLPIVSILIVVSFIMMIIPFIIKIIRRKKLEYKKGSLLCFFNSLLLFIIFSVPNVLTIVENDYSETISIDPVAFAKKLIFLYFIIAIIYYFINLCLFVEKRKIK